MPIVISAIVAALLSSAALYYRIQFANAQRAAAELTAQHARDLQAISNAALSAEHELQIARTVAAQKIETLDSELTKMRQKREIENRNYRNALATGTERLRVAVKNCSAGGGNLPGATSAASLGNDATAYADLDGKTAERIFAVAIDDQREIDKLRALQGYVCAVRPETAGCQ